MTTTPTPDLAVDPAIVAYLVTNLSSGEPSLCFEDERGDYGDEDHMPVFEPLVRESYCNTMLATMDEQLAMREAYHQDQAQQSMAIIDAAWMAIPQELREPPADHKTVHPLAACVSAMAAKLERLQADARRYKWLADAMLCCDYGDNDAPGQQIGWSTQYSRRNDVAFMYGDSIDAAIDAAMGEKL